MSQSLAITLPGLQARLDALEPGGRLTLGIGDYRRLFGVNDVGAERLALFAAGHGCEIQATPSSVTFRKTGATRS